MKNLKVVEWTLFPNYHAPGTSYVIDKTGKQIAFCQTEDDAKIIVEANNNRQLLLQQMEDIESLLLSVEEDSLTGIENHILRIINSALNK